jgi:DNA-binding transcriptional LysR family regulator
LQRSDLLAFEAIVVADSARLMPTRTVGLLSGQQCITVPDIGAKIALQKAGLGHGFLPRPCAERDLKAGRLIELPVAEPKPEERFYLAWRSEPRNDSGNENHPEGEALKWWRKRLSRRLLPDCLHTVWD